MKKQVLVALALLTFGCLGWRTASAQWPGGLKIPKVSRPRPTPSPAGDAQPAFPAETQPAAAPRSDAPAATTRGPAAPPAPPQAGGPKVIATRVQFRPATVSSYKGDFDVWSWIPRVYFNTEGALPSGAHYYVEVAQPGGAPWVKSVCVHGGGSLYECGDRDRLQDSAILTTGVFTFAIKMRNELQGTDQTLFTGRAKVEKALSNEHGPKAVRKFVYYANHDWNLPIGQVSYDEDRNRLKVRFWVRGGNDGLEPHLFYRGQEVTMNWAGEIRSGGSCSSDIEFRPTHSVTENLPQGAVWTRIDCSLHGAIARPNADNPGAHAVSAKPGEYEVKVLRQQRLARSIKFAVGPDGNLVDNGVAASIGIVFSNFVMVPVAILDDRDGPWDRNAWKTDAFYGNPPAGFTWPPQ